MRSSEVFGRLNDSAVYPELACDACSLDKDAFIVAQWPLAPDCSTAQKSTLHFLRRNAHSPWYPSLWIPSQSVQIPHDAAQAACRPAPTQRESASRRQHHFKNLPSSKRCSSSRVAQACYCYLLASYSGLGLRVTKALDAQKIRPSLPLFIRLLGAAVRLDQSRRMSSSSENNVQACSPLSHCLWRYSWLIRLFVAMQAGCRLRLRLHAPSNSMIYQRVLYRIEGNSPDTNYLSAGLEGA